jgi:hypothetical protein
MAAGVRDRRREPPSRCRCDASARFVAAHPRVSPAGAAGSAGHPQPRRRRIRPERTGARMTISTFEWLEADGLGGFASGTSTGVRTRRYTVSAGRDDSADRAGDAGQRPRHGWRPPPDGARSPRSATHNVVHRTATAGLTAFVNDPWPRWMFTLEDVRSSTRTRRPARCW